MHYALGAEFLHPWMFLLGWDCLGAKKAVSKKQAQWLGFTVLKGAEVDFFYKIGLVKVL